eukprot:TRINITY_DN7434_c0_g2_i1.p1 TRINITY_DN7434_c0_g2~~TRINITY_DN7434_c0_g2_i1.p1  ORF type:complete len:187 (-),score=30.64 TRINITY_DN7434_c0_g2_i1:121-681(-)
MGCGASTGVAVVEQNIAPETKDNNTKANEKDKSSVPVDNKATEGQKNKEEQPAKKQKFGTKQHPHPHPLEVTGRAPYFEGKYVCNDCTENKVGPLAHCKTCNYNNCLACYSKNIGWVYPKPVENEVPHGKHPHPHPLIHYPSTYYPSQWGCDSCRELSEGEQYHCSKCLYDNCKACYLKLAKGEEE